MYEIRERGMNNYMGGMCVDGGGEGEGEGRGKSA